MDSRFLEAVVVGILTALVAGFFGIGADRAAPTNHSGSSLTETGQRDEAQVKASFAL
jgi:hypothetical protein